MFPRIASNIHPPFPPLSYPLSPFLHFPTALLSFSSFSLEYVRLFSVYSCSVPLSFYFVPLTNAFAHLHPVSHNIKTLHFILTPFVPPPAIFYSSLHSNRILFHSIPFAHPSTQSITNTFPPDKYQEAFSWGWESDIQAQPQFPAPLLLCSLPWSLSCHTSESFPLPPPLRLIPPRSTGARPLTLILVMLCWRSFIWKVYECGLRER